MKLTPVSGIDGLLVAEPLIFSDERGVFFESFNKVLQDKLGDNIEFVQDNQSVSSKNVVRGLHFQRPPFAQGKLVRVVHGKALDVVVDLRKASSSYGKVFSILLTPEKSNMLWIPPGFAHGFAALEDNTVFLYKCTAPYNRESESGIVYNDATLAIDWGVSDPVVSSKDLDLEAFESLNSPF
jgi:dTDP-4-dehydrorhamnose 3,5-epimerase